MMDPRISRLGAVLLFSACRGASPAVPRANPSEQPRLVLPSRALAPDDREYGAWLKVQHLPAITTDGSKVARFDVSGYDEREGRGDTVSLLITAADGTILQNIELLHADETYTADDSMTPNEISAAQVAPRVREALAALGAHQWLPLTPMEFGTEGALTTSNAAGEVSVRLEGTTLTVRADGKTSTRSFPAWEAPPVAPCHENPDEFEPGCGCEYPLVLMGGASNEALGVLVLSVWYEITHTCEDPPAGRQIVYSYREK